MSLDKSDKKGSAQRDQEYDVRGVKGSYTEEGFYRRNNPQPAMNLSNLSQKESIYDNKAVHTVSDIGYTTLNPVKYGASASGAGQE
jgi:hypothetical protein